MTLKGADVNFKVIEIKGNRAIGSIRAALREELTIGDGTNGGYSPEYVALTRDFYLKFD